MCQDHRSRNIHTFFPSVQKKNIPVDQTKSRAVRFSTEWPGTLPDFLEKRHRAAGHSGNEF